MQSSEKIQAIRNKMQTANLQALIVPQSDEYLGEYLPKHNERLAWLTGFTGSAGMAIILETSAAVFADGRYTEQAPKQCDPDLYQIHHIIKQPPIKWLLKQLKSGDRIGLDDRAVSYQWYLDQQPLFAKAGVELVSLAEANPIDQCWLDRPQIETKQALLLGTELTGESSLSKRQKIAQQLTEQETDAALLFQTDSIAWLFNLRGKDIDLAPLLLSHAIISSNSDAVLFADARKIPNAFGDHVEGHVTVKDYALLATELAAYKHKKILIDKNGSSAWICLQLEKVGATLVAGKDPVALPRAQKNSTEIEGMKNAHIRDGAAKTMFLAWLDKQVAAGNLMDEQELADRLHKFRQECDKPFGKLQGKSFETISAAGANAAMPHYRPDTADKPAKLQMNNLYKVDSGAQYIDGTTDVTRTIAIGTPTDEMRKLFTLVLKGHIGLDRIKFPRGTSGHQLDILARQHLWNQGYEYDHGTGHGVGCFLNVHEGPQGISPRPNATPLLPGMVVSNEPGYYRPGAFGIRCENLVVVQESKQIENRLEFEKLTLVPFDKRLIDQDLLTETETTWINEYHQRIYSELKPLVDQSTLQWLSKATASL